MHQPTLNPTAVDSQIKVNVELGEGWVCSCSDTDIDSLFLHSIF